MIGLCKMIGLRHEDNKLILGGNAGRDELLPCWATGSCLRFLKFCSVKHSQMQIQDADMFASPNLPWPRPCSLKCVAYVLHPLQQPPAAVVGVER